MIMLSYLDKLMVLVNKKGSDSGTRDKEIKEAYCFIKARGSPKTKTSQKKKQEIYHKINSIILKKAYYLI